MILGNKQLMKIGIDPLPGPTPVFETPGVASVGTLTGTTFTVAYPATVNAGDILFLTAYQYGYGSNTIITSSGWTGLITQRLGVAQFCILWKRADGTESGNATVNVPSASFANCATQITRYSGCIGEGTPWENFANRSGAFGGQDTLTTNNPAVTLGDNRLSVAMYGAAANFGQSFTISRAGTFNYVERTVYQLLAAAYELISVDTYPIATAGGIDGTNSLTYNSTRATTYHNLIMFHLIPEFI